MSCNWKFSQPVRLQILISQKLFEAKCLLFASNKISVEAAVWSWSFSWVWSGMPSIRIVLWHNKLPISLERVVGFSQACWIVLRNKSVILILKKIGPWTCTFLGVKMMHHSCLCDSASSLMPVKTGFQVAKIHLANQFSRFF